LYLGDNKHDVSRQRLESITTTNIVCARNLPFLRVNFRILGLDNLDAHQLIYYLPKNICGGLGYKAHLG